jgi:signal transduction histidine kinase/CheY-like chemotaxis protein
VEIGVFTDRSENEAAFRTCSTRLRTLRKPAAADQDGHRVEVEFVSNVYEVDHRLVAQCNIRDISERVRLERQMVEQAEELASLDRRKDEFLAMLSHELRNPLAPMMNAVQLLRLQQASENPVQRQYRTIIERQLGQLRQLVNDLLEVSRITTGRVRLRQERIDVRGIVESALETVRPQIEKHRHEISVSVPAEPVWLLADPARLEQVLVNLLTNAAKYTDEGGQVSLAVKREADSCVIRVRDTGVGIAPELLPRIFDLFTQADRLLDRSEGGLGIGLCLVQRLVELHGGTVLATSVVGEGSEFVVRLPVDVLSPMATPAPVAARVEAAQAGLRVFVVDDNVDMALSMAMLVKASGHEVRVFHDGPTTLLAVVSDRPDAVLLDIGLPGMDGHEVARRIRQQPAAKTSCLWPSPGMDRTATARSRSTRASTIT